MRTRWSFGDVDPTKTRKLATPSFHHHVRRPSGLEDTADVGRVEGRSQAGDLPVDPRDHLSHPRVAGVAQDVLGLAGAAEAVVEVDDALGAVDDAAPHRCPGLGGGDRGPVLLGERVTELHEGQHRLRARRVDQRLDPVDGASVVGGPVAAGIAQRPAIPDQRPTFGRGADVAVGVPVGVGRHDLLEVVDERGGLLVGLPEEDALAVVGPPGAAVVGQLVVSLPASPRSPRPARRSCRSRRRGTSRCSPAPRRGRRASAPTACRRPGPRRGRCCR